MTLNELIKYLPFIQAASEGKVVQRSVLNYMENPPKREWMILYNDLTDYHVEHLRIKPTSTLRPWTAEEVPVGAFVRWKKDGIAGNEFYRGLILASFELYVRFGAFETEKSFQELLDNMEHSLDHGKTWLPCGVSCDQ